MSATSFELEVVTPERKVYDGRVKSVVFPAADGLTGVLPNHAPLLSAIDLGQLKIEEEGGATQYMFISDGFLEVAENKCRILADVGETADEIDLERARKAEERARALLAKRGEGGKVDIDFLRAEIALQRAIWRMLIKGKSGR